MTVPRISVFGAQVPVPTLVMAWIAAVVAVAITAINNINALAAENVRMVPLSYSHKFILAKLNPSGSPRRPHPLLPWLTAYRSNGVGVVHRAWT